ncbi:MAG: hypothetical protein ACETVV_01240 [Nitrososphaeria archaeon]
MARRLWLNNDITIINVLDLHILDRSVRIKRLRVLGLALMTIAILLFVQTGMNLPVALLFVVGLSVVQVRSIGPINSGDMIEAEV